MPRRALCLVFWMLLPWPGLFVLLGPASLWPWAALAGWCGLLVLLRPPLRPEADPGRCEAAFSAEPGAADVLLRAAPEAVSWGNALQNEIGPFRMAAVLTGQAPPRLAVIPAGAALSADEQALLEKWVRQDGVAVLLECPENSPLAGLPPHPRWTQRDHGRGRVFVLGHNFGRERRELTQGRPNAPGGRIRKGLRLDPQGVQAQDLRADAPDRIFSPEADARDREILGRVRDSLLLPSWWLHPNGLPAAFALTFDEDWAGCSLDVGTDLPATWFLTDGCHPGANGPAAAACGFHWNRFLLHLTPTGLHLGLTGIKGQMRRLTRTLAHSIDICRVHYLRWDAEPTRTWRLMSRSGIRIDASLGPGRGQHGYRFGTGQPFRLVDADGCGLGMIEVPFHIHEPMGRAPLADHLRLLDEAATTHHGLVVALHHPLHCRVGGKSRENYLGLLRHLESWPGWVTDLASAVAFWELRRETGLESRFDDHRLTVRIPDGANGGLTLRLPRADRLVAVFVDGREMAVAALVPLPEAATLVQAIYQP